MSNPKKNKPGATKPPEPAPPVPEEPSEEPIEAPPPRLSLRKRLAFGAVALLLLMMMSEGVLALFGVRPRLVTEDPFVGFASYVPLFVAHRGAALPRGGEARMVTAENKLKYFNRQSFAKKKAAGVRRVFCVGGSTTFGRPYKDATSFCGWLGEMLPEADPSHSWELINAGGISYASYRVARVMEELANLEPDLFIVYTGQNEFLEKRTYAHIIDTPGILLDADALLSKTRTYTALRRALQSITGGESPGAGGKSTLAGEVDTLLDRSVGLDAYQRDEELRRGVIEHYRSNLRRMIDIARAAGAEIVLVTPASNLRDCTPFKSQHRDGLSQADRKQWKLGFAEAQEAHNAERDEEALAATDRALDIDDLRADLHHLRGRILWSLERFDEAKASFLRARDEDVCPLRALSAMSSIVREVAVERDVAVVDFVKLVASRSDHDTPGAEFFLDHVHPTIEGHRLLAEALIDALAATGFVHLSAQFDDAAKDRIAKKVTSRLDAKDHQTALLNLGKVLSWAGKDDEAKALALRAARINPDDALAHFQIGASALNTGAVEEAITHLQRALEIDPDRADGHFMLASALDKAGRGDEALHHYRRAIEIKPDYAKAQAALGTALALRGQSEEAIRHLRESVRLNPDGVSAQYNLATALQSRGDTTAAVHHFTRAATLDPRHFGARFNLGLALRAMGNLDDAVRQLQAALRLRPRDAAVRYQLGVTLEAVGRGGDALRHLRGALADRPDDPATLRATAWILATNLNEALRDPDEAVRLAVRATTLTKRRDLGALDTLSAVYAAVGRFPEAIETDETAIAVASDSPQTAHLVEPLRARIEQYRARMVPP